MQLSKWIKKHSAEELRKLAGKCNCAVNYLYHVATNGCSPKLAKKIEKWTTKLTPGHVVHKWELLPDIWEKPKKMEKK